MGTDIHFNIEKKTDSVWYALSDEVSTELWDTLNNRDYDLFGCIANVRNYNDLPSMNTFRQIPNDISDTVLKVLEDWGCDKYCYWATLKEFYDFYLETPNTFKQNGIIIGKDLDEFKKTGKPPQCYCRGYYGHERNECCIWETDYYPMDDFMVALLTASYCAYQKIIPLEDIRTSENIKDFVNAHGEEIRGVFCFDS